MNDYEAEKTDQGRALAPTESVLPAKRRKATRQERVEVCAGQYWRTTKKTDHGAKGLVLLVSDVQRIDGEIHSVIVQSHPESGESKYSWATTYHIDEFHKTFSFEPDGMRIREAELAALQQRIAALQQEMNDGPPPAAADQLALGPGRAALPSGAEKLGALAVPGAKERVQKQVSHQIVVAERHAAWLEKRGEDFKGELKSLGAYHSERVQVALATVQDARKYAKELGEALKTFSLYTGEDVQVETAVKGAPAPESEPLVLFQRLLLMDEEYAVHALGRRSGSEKFTTFLAAIAKDPALRDRVLPMPRCAVAMRFSNNHLPFDENSVKGMRLGDAFAAMYAHMEKQAEDRKAFLLVRNGENVHAVYSPLATDQATRLFPTTNELEKPFVGYDGRTLTLEDVRYFEAHEERKDIELHYKRLLVLMWGLQDRLNLFGDFYDHTRYPSGFLDPDLQSQRFRYIFDEEAGALGGGRPTWSDWLAARNAYLAPGSRVLCFWEPLLTPEVAPACAKYGQRMSSGNDYVDVSYTTTPQASASTCIVLAQSNELLVKHAVKHRFNDRVINAAFHLSAADTGSYLVLDEVDPEDLEYYIQSRINRKDYLRYLPMLIAARDALRKERAQSQPIRDRVAAEMVEGGVVDAAAAARSAATAVRLWRCAHRGEAATDKTVGVDGLRAVRDVAYAIGVGYPHLRGALEAYAAQTGTTPVRATINGDATLRFFFHAPTAQRPDGERRPPFITSARLRLVKGKVVVDSATTLAPNLRTPADEYALCEWPNPEIWPLAVLPKGLNATTYRKAIARIELWKERKSHFDAPTSDDARELCAAATRFGRASRYIEHPRIRIDIGLMAKRRGNSVVWKYVGLDRNAFNALYALAPDARPLLVAHFKARAAHPEVHCERLENAVKKPDEYPWRLAVYETAPDGNYSPYSAGSHPSEEKRERIITNAPPRPRDNWGNESGWFLVTAPQEALDLLRSMFPAPKPDKRRR